MSTIINDIDDAVAAGIIHELDHNDDTGETLYALDIANGLTISVIVTSDGTELYTSDWQNTQPQTFADVPEYRWLQFEEFDW